MAALACVFDTVELFEAILVCLPTRELLLIQRVSKRWRDVISGSIKLQRALFFEPNKGDPLTLALDDTNAKKHWIRVDNNESELVKNPMLDPLFRLIEARGGDFSLGAGLPPAWRNENASWRRMLPAQPALYTSTYVGLWGLPEFWCAFYTEKTMPIFCTRDVRVGQIFDELDERFGRFPYGKKQIVIVGLNCAAEDRCKNGILLDRLIHF